MPTLDELNDEFLKDAKDIRYSYMQGGHEIWSNKRPDGLTPFTGSFYRSTRYAYPRKKVYLMGLDIDGNGIDERTLEAARALFNACHLLLGVRPVLKASGMKGIQLLIDVQFPNWYTDKTMAADLADVAYTVYLRSQVFEKHGIAFGRGLGGIYVDTCMFDQSRVIRSFCKHLGSGFYSIPFSYADSVDQIIEMMHLSRPLPEVVLHEVWYPEVARRIEPYRAAVRFETQSPSDELMAALDAMDTKRARAGKPDSIYYTLTPRLQKIVNMDSDIHHDFKWPLVAYMHVILKMDAGAILQWVWNNCRWEDLDDVNVTQYQIEYTCRWARRISEAGRDPIPKWVRREGDISVGL